MNGDELARLIEEVHQWVDGLLIGYNAINFPYRDAGVEAAGKYKLGLVTMNPLAGGELFKYPERFGFIRTRPGQSILNAALSFNLSNPNITAALVGCRNVSDVADAVAESRRLVILNKAQRDGLKKNIEDSFNKLCTGCRYCKVCPENIPVAKLMESYNFFLLSKEPKQAKDRLQWHWGINSPDTWKSCIECRKCEEVCTQHLPILERMEELTRTYG
jgi:predicted aldo/keto reductase-like oxidoreductase